MKTVQQLERLEASQRHNASPRLSIAAVAAPIDRAIWFGPFCLRPQRICCSRLIDPFISAFAPLDPLIVLVACGRGRHQEGIVRSCLGRPHRR
jgi:hypothetical protein